METVCHTAYQTSSRLAEEKGSFPQFEKELFLERPLIRQLPEEIRDRIADKGIRNSHLLSIAPTGSISILANNVSNGVEHVYDFKHTRRVLNVDGTHSVHKIVDYAYWLWKEFRNKRASLPDYFITAGEVPPVDHLKMQAALQQNVDNAISKTINIPEEYPFEMFRDIYTRAWEMGVKGCTTYRPNPVTGSVLEYSDGEAQVHCCTLERETD